MKKLTALLLAGAMVLSLAACGGGNNSGNGGAASNGGSSAGGAASSAGGASSAADYSALDPVELIGGDSSGKGAAAQLLGEMIAEKLDTITGGQLTMDYHPNSDLGGDADLLRQTQSGEIDIVVCQIAPAVSFIPDLAVFDLPMVFSKYDGATIDKVLNGDGEFRTTLDASYEAAGFHLLGFLQNATYRLTSANAELKTLDDFKGLQIRTMENANHMDFWKAIGAAPTPLAWPEVYFALQSGTIDAEENAADTIVGANLNEVQKYLACTNHILYCNQVSINKDNFDALDPLYQAAIEQAVSESLAELSGQLAQIDADNKADLQNKGMTIIEYGPEFYDEILGLDSVKALYTKIDGDVNGLGTKLQEELANA